MTEISDSELSSLLSRSTDVVREFITSHPEVLYKGIPLVLVIWLLYPLLALAWGWLPWIWASYEIYKLVPSGILTYTYKTLRNSETIFEIVKNLEKTE